jgi:ABC-2 type transport system ATP-binding protein
MPIITVSNLIKKFGDMTAVNGISFSVEKGEIFAFLGPNGAGKTTTIKMLTTLLSPTSGEIDINGFNVVKNKDKARASFGIVFQDPSLEDELTAKENMDFHGVLYNIPKNIREKRIEELLHFVDLWDKKDLLVKTFSGGMKRRLEIARGLLHHPKIFFLDEPTQGLDPQTRNHMWSYIKNLSKNEGITIFFTTHYLEEAQEYADKVAIMDQGKIITIGTLSEILEKTNKTTLEEGFLSLTGNAIRDETIDGIDNLRQSRKMWRSR